MKAFLRGGVTAIVLSSLFIIVVYLITGIICFAFTWQWLKLDINWDAHQMMTGIGVLIFIFGGCIGFHDEYGC